jgi:hypothetical protein
VSSRSANLSIWDISILDRATLSPKEFVSLDDDLKFHWRRTTLGLGHDFIPLPLHSPATENKAMPKSDWPTH